MNAKKILAVALVALLAVASFAPAFAADKENVMLNAEYYDSVNISPDKGDYFEINDEMIAVGPNHTVGGVNWRVTKDGVYNLYDIDGYDDEEGAYIGFVTYELDKLYDLNSFKMYVIDLAPLGVGVDNSIDWMPRAFDVLVSTTGEDGSWSVAWSGKDLHGEGDDAGVWQHADENDESLAHFVLDVTFDKAVEAKYIRWAPTAFNNAGDPTAAGARYFNISEWQVFGTVSPNQPAETEPAATEPAATEPAATEPAETEPAATEPAATEPAATEPAATDVGATEPAATEPAATEPATEPAVESNSSAILIVAAAVVAVLAVAVIVAIVLKKKKN